MKSLSLILLFLALLVADLSSARNQLAIDDLPPSEEMPDQPDAEDTDEEDFLYEEELVTPRPEIPLVVEEPEAVPVTDTTVLARLHDFNQIEIRMGQMAERRAESRRIKRLGDRVFRDHRYSDRMALSLSDKMGVDLNSVQLLPSEVEKQTHILKMVDLERQSGHEFDTNFLQAMEESHRDALDFFIRAREKLPGDSKVRVLMGQVIPVLEQHLSVTLHLKGQ